MNKVLFSAAITTLFAASAFSSQIDFTNDPLAAEVEAALATYSGTANDGVGFTLSINTGDLTAHESVWGIPGSTYDGVGVTDDEVGGTIPEILTLSFDQKVRLSTVTLYDLFWEDDNVSNTTVAGTPNSYLETGKYSLNGGSNWTYFSATTSSLRATGGVYTLSFNSSIDVESIMFSADARNPGDNDYALAKVNYSVPEPSTFSLLGIGLLGIAGFFRRKKRS